MSTIALDRDTIEADDVRYGRARDWIALAVGFTARTTLGTLIGLLFWASVPALIGWVPTTVMSGSMMPRIVPGDVVVAMPVAPDQLRAGQVILFPDPDHADRDRLHRLNKVLPGGDFRTRGDANSTADSTPVNPHTVRGVALVRVPFAGLPVLWIRTGAVIDLVVGAGVVAALLALSNVDGYLRRSARTRRHGSGVHARQRGAHSARGGAR